MRGRPRELPKSQAMLHGRFGAAEQVYVSKRFRAFCFKPTMSALRSSFAALSRVARNLPASRPIVSIARHPGCSYVHLQPARGYAVASGLTNEAIETRVLDVIKSFEKVSPEKVRLKNLFGISIHLTISAQCCEYRSPRRRSSLMTLD